MREQKEQEKQNELLRVVAEQNHERLIEYDVKEDRAVVYAIENDLANSLKFRALPNTARSTAPS